jgi:hypothetical protein
MSVEKLEGHGAACLDQVVAILRQYDGLLLREDAKDIICHLAMIFSGQDEKAAAFMLHEAGMDLVFYHGLLSGR